VLLLDGAMGTMLQDAGLDDGGAGELWNVERPEAIAAIHEAYAAAGARVLTTNTFGGTRPRLAMHDLEDRVEELSRAGAALARGVADRHGALVAGDLGPTGSCSPHSARWSRPTPRPSSPSSSAAWRQAASTWS
jgi:5-methyltetrahydrofolate--homocysteine methyltransferase